MRHIHTTAVAGVIAMVQVSVMAQVSTTSTAAAVPDITSPDDVSITQAAPFVYQVTAVPSPTSYGAIGLPAGISINPATGLISGTVLTAVPATVEVTATNDAGQGRLALSLTPTNISTAVGTNNNCSADATVPAAAANMQWTRLVFCDDFDSLDTIDTKGTGAEGFNWYTYRPSGLLPQSAYTVANSALTLTDSQYAYNWGLSTSDMRTGNGQSWTFGYFEARISFNPTLGTSGSGWPSFWSVSEYKATHLNAQDFGEIDFFEAFPQNSSPGNYYGAFGGTVHDWHHNLTSGADVESSAGYTDYINGRNVVPSDVDWTQWHVVGCLWTPGQITWYLDGRQMLTQQYSASTQGNPVASDATGATPAPIGVWDIIDAEQMGMMLILGTGPNWPIHVDYVRVWKQ